MNADKKQKIEVKYSVFIEIMKSALNDVILKEALKEGEIIIVDDITNKYMGNITFKKYNK